MFKSSECKTRVKVRYTQLSSKLVYTGSTVPHFCEIYVDGATYLPMLWTLKEAFEVEWVDFYYD